MSGALPEGPGARPDAAAVARDALSLLRRTPPFSILAEPQLAALAGEASLAFYAAGSMILNQGSSPEGRLALVKSGSVKVFFRTNENEDLLLDVRGAGSFFGILAILREDISMNSAAAVEDTVCFLLPKDPVLRILREEPGTAEYFLRFYIGRFHDMMRRVVQERTLLYGSGDKLLFTSRLRDVATKGIVKAPAAASIREAAAIMAANKVSSLVITDEAGYPAGIVTDRDLREKVLARQRSADDPVSGIMSVTLIKADADDYCFEALVKMIRYQIHHLLVVDRGELTGIITNHDLMMMQGASPLSLAREIGTQSSVEGLAPSQQKINRMIMTLAREGARASTVTRIITEVNDRIETRLLELAEAKLGPPPAAYCWIVFGSEGRKEQTFRTDQDNALIYEDLPAGREREAAAYFAGLGRFMQDALVRTGFPPCPAGYMAGTERWRRPLSVWKEYFRTWIGAPTPEAVLFSLIFFDFRPVQGDFQLAERLRASLNRQLKDSPLFFTRMAATVGRNRPPLGLLKRIRFGRAGEHRHAINIKVNGIAPIVDLARLSALEAGQFNTSTLDRLRDLGGNAGGIAAQARELEEAFEFLMGLRLRHQVRQKERGREPDNLIARDELTNMETRTLECAFRTVLAAQQAMQVHFHAHLAP